MGLASVH